MFYALITIPDTTTFFASIGTWSSAVFDNLLPIALWITGIGVGGLLIGGLVAGIYFGVRGLIHKD